MFYIVKKNMINMGVQISNILPKKEIEIADLIGRKIAVDAFLWLHQFLSIIRQRDGTPLKDSQGRITSHLSGLFYRSAKLIENNIKLVWVFDGERPEFKSETINERNKIREDAQRKWKEALEAGDMEAARKAAQSTSKLTGEIIEQSKELLGYMGIPVVQAPSEGEAQCAYLCEQRDVYSVASQDNDSLLFNSPRLVRNLNIVGKRKLPGQNVYVDVKPQIIELENVFKELEITKEQLIILGILVGTDFNPGVRGYGPKRSLELVKKEKTLKRVLEKIDWNYEVPANNIYEFFLYPEVNEKVDIEFKAIQPEKIMEFLVEEHDFSKERIEKVIDRLTKKKQKSLDSWIK